MSNDRNTPGWPAADDEDAIRRRQIEEMMRVERPRYFRDELVQQEYRDIVDRQIAAQEAAVAAARGPGPFDIALAQFKERRAGAAENPEPQVTAENSLFALDVESPSGVSGPDDDSVGDKLERSSPQVMEDDLAKGYAADLPQLNNRQGGLDTSHNGFVLRRTTFRKIGREGPSRWLPSI